MKIRFKSRTLESITILFQTNEMGDTNLSLADILTELIESEEVIGCGFGDKNGLTLAVEGDISM